MTGGSSARAPLLFRLREDTYLLAFSYAALTAAVTTGIVLEYRLSDPFGTYLSPHGGRDLSLVRPSSRASAVLQTCVVAFVATMFSLVVLHLLFSLGDSMLVVPP